MNNAQILSDAEREYLSAVIKPFRNRVVSIQKKCFKNSEYIHMNLKAYFDITTPDYATFPLFEKGTMYKGMKTRRKYTPEELGL